MMKKIFSKRSGFTLVEIVVAFAVFAIMAGMILQVLNLVMMEKQNNADFAEKLQKQEELIVKNGRTGEYKDEDKTGTLSVTFGKDKYDIDYQMMFPETEDKKSRYEDGLAYYIGPGEKGSNADDDIGGSIDVTAGAGAQMERMDTRITGTGGFKSINVYRVVKDETYSGDGARYFIEVSADGSEMENEIVPYAQYKLYFFMKDELDAGKSNINYTAPDGSTYKRKVPKEATIIDAGYVNDTDLVWSDSTCKSFVSDTSGIQPAMNKYNIKKLNDNCIRIGSPYVKGNADGVDLGGEKRGVRFMTSLHSRFYVVFAEDPQLTEESFGQSFGSEGNVEKTDGKIVYKNVPILDDSGNPSGDNYVNIYGAFDFEKKTD